MRFVLKRAALLSAFVLFAASAHAATPSVSLQLISSSAGVAPGKEISLAVITSGFNDPTYSVSDSFSGSSVSSSDIDSAGYFSWTPTLLDAGAHQITVNVSDSYKDMASSTITLQVVSNAVILQSISPGALVAFGRPVSFTVLAPGFVNPAFTVSDSYPGTSISGANIVASSGTFSWTPAINQQGVHALTIYAYDAYGHSGNVSEVVTVTSPQVNITSLMPGRSAAVGTKITFAAIASGLASTTTFSLGDTFVGTSTISSTDIGSSGLFSWTPTASDAGIHTLVVTAQDGFGNAASTTQLLTITPALSLPAPTPTFSTTVTLPTAPTSTSKPSPTTYVFSKLLAVGSGGAGVTALQNRLTALGFYSGPVSGYYGALTAAAVRRFQIAKGLSPIGYLGPLTRAALNNL